MYIFDDPNDIENHKILWPDPHEKVTPTTNHLNSEKRFLIHQIHLVHLAIHRSLRDAVHLPPCFLNPILPFPSLISIHYPPLSFPPFPLSSSPHSLPCPPTPILLPPTHSPVLTPRSLPPTHSPCRMGEPLTSFPLPPTRPARRPSIFAVAAVVRSPHNLLPLPLDRASASWPISFYGQ